MFLQLRLGLPLPSHWRGWGKPRSCTMGRVLQRKRTQGHKHLGQHEKGLPTWYQWWRTRLPNAGDPGDVGSIPGWGRFPGGGHGNPLQLSCLGNLMDRGAWWATVHGVAESDTTGVTWQAHIPVRNWQAELVETSCGKFIRQIDGWSICGMV